MSKGKSGMSTANGRQNTRHKAAYQAYRNEERRERNKARRLARHLTRYPGDGCAKAALEALPLRCRRGYGEALTQ